jgi:hypothetical protein
MTNRARPGAVRRHEARAAALGVLAEARRGHAGLFWFAVALAGLAVVALCGVVVDDRMLVGAAIWLKPLKFALSFGLYAFTSAWLLSLVRYRSRIGAVLGAALGWAVVATSAIEIGIIVLQVVRGKRSHFNTETAFDEQLFSIMGATVAVIWLATPALAVLVLLRGSAGRPTTVAIRLGLLIGLAGMGLGVLSVVNGGHSVGVPDGGPGLPLFGWSTTGGDLQIGHFVGMHALQVLPLLAVASAAVLGGSLVERGRVRLVLVTAAGYAGLVGLLTWQALRGRPLFAPDVPTVVAGVGLLVAVAVGVALTMRATSAR